MKLILPGRSNYPKWDAPRHPRLHYLAPEPTFFQRGVLPFGLKVFDLMLNVAEDPDALIQTGYRLNRLISGLKMRRIRVGHCAWPYLEGGKGDLVVLLHGFGADKDRFGSFLTMIRRGFHVVVPDIPGFGEHEQVWDDVYDVGTQVRRIERFLETLGLERFHLMGISLGGYLASLYASRNAHRVTSLCLMDTAGFSSSANSDALQLYEDEARNIFLPKDEADMQLMVDYLLYRPLVLPVAFRRYWLQQTMDLMAWREKLFDDLLSGGLYLMDGLADRIKAPTLVVWGAEDRICHVSTVETIMARIENCRSYILHGCGHIPIVEHPGLSARLYMDFLGKCGKDASGF